MDVCKAFQSLDIQKTVDKCDVDSMEVQIADVSDGRPVRRSVAFASFVSRFYKDAYYDFPQLTSQRETGKLAR